MEIDFKRYLRKPRGRKYCDYVAENDLFENRWNKESRQFYLFNPYTGETVYNQDGINRSISTWAVAPGKPHPLVKTTILLPEYYASRQWGRRKFYGWATDEPAVIHMQAVARGFLARKLLGEYFRSRYSKVLDEQSGYYYFRDTYNPEAEPSWHKPRLAFPYDILVPPKEPDPDDFMNGKKFSYMGFVVGPYCRQYSVGKKQTIRSKVVSFTIENDWRDTALSRPEELDLEKTPVGSVIAWMDGLKAVEYEVTDYAVMRTAVTRGDWLHVLEIMRTLADHEMAQIFGMHSFTKMEIEADRSGRLTKSLVAVFLHIMQVLEDPGDLFSLTHKVFALHALYHLVSTPAGRAEFFDTDGPPEGDTDSVSTQNYIRELITSRITILNRILIRAPRREVKIEVPEWMQQEGQAKGELVVVEEPTLLPTLKAIDSIEIGIKCIGALAHAQDYRETLAQDCAINIVRAATLCSDEARVVLAALRTLYNLCYRSESGHEAVVLGGAKDLLDLAESRLSSDFDVTRQCRRLKLALSPDGWRGNVEAVIEREMKGGFIFGTGVDDGTVTMDGMAMSKTDFNRLDSGGMMKDSVDGESEEEGCNRYDGSTGEREEDMSTIATQESPFFIAENK